MRKTIWKRLCVLLMTLSVLLCAAPQLPSAPDADNAAVYADAIDDYMNWSALSITQLGFGDDIKVELPEKNTWTGRTYESGRNTLKSIGMGKGIPAAAQWVGSKIGKMGQWGVSKINELGRWGANLHNTKAMQFIGSKLKTAFPKVANTLSKIGNSKGIAKIWQKLEGFRVKKGMTAGGFNRAANLGVGIYGFKQMWDEPKVGYESPALELLGNSIRGIGNTATVVSAFVPEGWSEAIGTMGDAFLISDIIVNSPLTVELANEAVRGFRDLDTKWGHPLPTSMIVGLMDLYDIEVDTANGTMQDFFSTVFFEGPENIKNWWNYLIWGIEGNENEQNLLELQRKAKGSTFQGNGVGVYKPNIYLYPEAETDVRVTFARPELLTVTDPLYDGTWRVTAEPDGTLHTDGGTYGYLFYESLTDPLDYQYTEGYVIPADARAETFTEILRGYGLNETEIADFIGFWCDKLDAGCDYAMYPQMTETLDVTMPAAVSPAPDSFGRIWFAFEKNGRPEKQAEPEAFARDGFTVIEWGGFFRRSS